MPSSLTVNLSSASVYSTRPPVSVCGTGFPRLWLSGFSRQQASADYRIAPGGAPYFRASPLRTYFTARRKALPFNVLFRQHAPLTLLRLRIAPWEGNGIFTVCPSRVALRLALRSRLTLIRLALIRNPWPSGGGVSRPSCRYLYLHLLFPKLHTGSRPCFSTAGMLPYQSRLRRDSMASATVLCPIIIHAGPLDQ